MGGKGAMFRRILFFLAWCVMLYVFGCIGAAAVAMAQTAAQHPASVADLGPAAAGRLIEFYRLHILVGALLVAVIGSFAGLLPGTGRAGSPIPIQHNRWDR
jgi:hypothetical protein